MLIFKKIFKNFFITIFLIMLTTQFMLKNSFIKTKISNLYNLETQYVFYEQDNSKGYITLNISIPSKDIFVLQNGEKVCMLDSQETKVEIYDNSVIEIDGRKSITDNNVKVSLISDNLKGLYEKEISLNSNIVILGRFFIK